MTNDRSSTWIRRSMVMLTLVSLFVIAWWTSAAAQSLRPSDPEGARPFKTYLPVVFKSAATVPETWLGATNAYRTMARLLPLAENTAWNDGCVNHARYIVKNDVIDHTEDPNNPWYTPEGAVAAQTSNLIAATGSSYTDRWAIDAWLTTPFHALSILDPHLRSTGFGSYREGGAGYRMAAVIDVTRGRGALPAGTSFPIIWPGPGATIPLRTYFASEVPSSLTSCLGYAAPTGVPIMVQMGDGSQTPHVTAHSFVKTAAPAVPLASCVFTEATYTNPDPALQTLGRALLDLRDAIVLIPRAALDSGASYTVSLTVDGQIYTWTFSVAQSTE